MSQLRYVRDMSAGTQTPAVLNNTVRTIRVVYETDPEIVAALLPKPLEPLERPEIYIQCCHVAMHMSAQTIEIGAATVAVMCSYKGRKGGYVLAMPMEGEFVVIGGREIFGEPKKIAAVEFDVKDGKFSTKVERHGIPFIEINGSLGKTLGPAEYEEKFYCYKALPSIRRDGSFDGDVLLTQLNWKRNYSNVQEAQGELILRESAYDPLADVPVKKLVSMQYAEGNTQTSGEILQKVPDSWFAPFIHQRYDDTTVPCVSLETETA